MDTQESRAIDLLQRMLTLHESVIGCDECCEQMECLAERVLCGQKAEGVLQAIQNHIECCHYCRQEFESLVVVLRAEQTAEG
jgi:hypothetical protein